MANEALCIFCGSIADTREHIPPKQLFKGISDKNLITVPSCLNCNRSFQNDEDFFRQFLATMLTDRSTVAKGLMDNEITRAIKRKPALGFQMFNQMKLVDVYTKTGIYLGQKTMYNISDNDKKRINRIVIKIIKGLFYHIFEQIVPLDWIVEIIWITPKSEKGLNLTQLAQTLKWNIIKEDTFAYGMNSVPETNQSIWIMDFFKVPLFYVLVLDKKTAKKE